ncbi:replicative DNA helicase [Desulfitispora alkaliphila]|uniref:replicative DNA helicase n=1 Tax=Desulfitispora alkaliphila TaxID=622674 RepID=UPI003D19CD0C
MEEVSAGEGSRLSKVPPHNLEAEQSVLGAMMIDKEAVYSVMEILSVGDFYRDAHNILYEAIMNLNEKSEPVDLITVTEELSATNKLEQVGGATYIASLAEGIPTAANVEYYAKIVWEKALLRMLIQASTKIAQRGYDSPDEIEELVDEAEQLIFSIGQKRTKEGFTPIKELLLETVDKIEALYQNRGQVSGVPTFADLDRMLSGLQKSDLIICAARPAMGKTSFCLNIAQSAAVKHNTPVAVFSLEMSKDQLVQRMLCSDALIDQQKMRTGNLQEGDWSRLVQAVGPLSEAPVFIDDTPAISVMEMRAKARRLMAEHGLGLIVIDYLQLMSSHRRVDSRQQEIAQISRALKGLARELNVPVMCLSQLNRGVEQRQDKRPVMSDLLESGSIEADADVVLFIYRDEYYDPESEKQGIAEIIVSKHRHGPVGTVELGFLKEFTKFVNLEKGRG